MTITAKIIADSISEQGIRLTTFQLRYPRFIHAEFMTHRVFSRNASSSRAVPVKRLIEDIEQDPAMPVWWGKNQSGMQAREELDQWEQGRALVFWLTARGLAVHSAKLLLETGAHKQIVNRVLEPFSHINVVVTATDYANFYALRRHPDAQPEIKVLADIMWETQEASKPVLLKPGEWHVPYYGDGVWRDFADGMDFFGMSLADAQKVSIARCARVSYLTFEGKKSNMDDDARLAEKLLASTPLHASPAEHQATPDKQEFWPYSDGQGGRHVWEKPQLHGNFRGWIQHRKQLADEFVAG